MVEFGRAACTLIDRRADHPRERVDSVKALPLRLGKQKGREIKRPGFPPANLTRRPKPQLICLNRCVIEAGRLCHGPIMGGAVDFSIPSATLCQAVTRAQLHSGRKPETITPSKFHDKWSKIRMRHALRHDPTRGRRESSSVASSLH